MMLRCVDENRTAVSADLVQISMETCFYPSFFRGQPWCTVDRNPGAVTLSGGSLDSRIPLIQRQAL